LAVYEFEGRAPGIAQSAFVAPSAQVIGDVHIGENCHIGHGAMVHNATIEDFAGLPLCLY
jgi:carbonic anhydrase/acetyltransferase-like protein (isoleucine patch superfamily)